MRADVQALLEASTSRVLTAAADDDYEDMYAELSLLVGSRLKRDQDLFAVLAGDLGLEDVHQDKLVVAQDASRDRAVRRMQTLLASRVADVLHKPGATEPARGEVSDFRVPPSITREVLAVAGGSLLNGVVSAVNGMPFGGVWTGETSRETLERVGRTPNAWRWYYGESDRKAPFASHADLDSVDFLDWQDDALAVREEDAWLGVTHYYPGDHDGCLCDFVPVFEGEADEL